MQWAAATTMAAVALAACMGPPPVPAPSPSDDASGIPDWATVHGRCPPLAHCTPVPPYADLVPYGRPGAAWGLRFVSVDPNGGRQIEADHVTLTAAWEDTIPAPAPITMTTSNVTVEHPLDARVSSSIDEPIVFRMGGEFCGRDGSCWRQDWCLTFRHEAPHWFASEWPIASDAQCPPPGPEWTAYVTGDS